MHLDACAPWMPDQKSTVHNFLDWYIYIYTPLTVKMRSNHMHLWIRVSLKVLHQHLQIYALKCQNSHIIKTARWIRINNRPCLHVQYLSHNLFSLLYHVYICNNTFKIMIFSPNSFTSKGMRNSTVRNESRKLIKQI